MKKIIINNLLLHAKLDLKAWIMMILYQPIAVKTKNMHYNKDFRDNKINLN